MRSHEALADLAEVQHGVVTFRQLRDLGFSKGHISRSFEADRLRRVHRGVYAVGHAGLSPYGRCMAAVLACGGGAALSHFSAAWLWGLHPICPADPDVTAPGRGHRRRGIRLHRVAALADSDLNGVDRIQTTSLPRTLLDLGATSPSRQLERAVERAERLDLLDLGAIDSMLARRRGTPGAKRLETALEIYRDPAFSRSRAELQFLDLVRKAGITRPALNFFIAGMEVDAYWESERFAVEIDGWDAHRTRSAFETDPVRQEDLRLAGIDSIRITARRIEREPDLVARRLQAHLDRRRSELDTART